MTPSPKLQFKETSWCQQLLNPNPTPLNSMLFSLNQLDENLGPTVKVVFNHVLYLVLNRDCKCRSLNNSNYNGGNFRQKCV